jgi:acyl dehydratase
MIGGGKREIMIVSPEEEKIFYYFDDFKEGQAFDLGSTSISQEDIIDFAQKYDPQPFHVDQEVAGFIFGGIIASGWHTAALCQRLLVDSFLSKTAGLGSPGVDELRFLKPVRPGDTLSGKLTITEIRPSKSKTDRGWIKAKGEMIRQDGEVVMSLVGTIIVARRTN